MKQYSIIHAPIMSLFSKAFYRDVGLYWKGTGLFYLFLIMAICWIPIIYVMKQDYNRFLDEEMPQLLKQVPEITINNGEVAIDRPEPYYIHNPENKNELMIIIDTTGQITSLANSDAFMLITKSQIEVKKSEYQTQTIKLDKADNITINANIITNWLESINRLFWPAIYPLLLISTFILRIILVLIYAAIGLVIASVCRAELTYAGAMRLAVMTLSPIIIAKTLLWVFHIVVPLGLLIFLGIYIAYLIFAIRACKPMPGSAGQQNTRYPPRQYHEPWQQ